MPSAPIWTSRDTSLLLDVFLTSNNKMLSELFPTRTLSAIHKKARKLGLRVLPEIEFQNRSNAHKGEKGANWKGGVRYTQKGYRQVLIPSHPRADKCGYVMEHIYVWEEANDRSVPDGCVIHHFNGIKDDNRAENLVLMTREEHTVLHHKGKIRTEETRQRISRKRRAD